MLETLDYGRVEGNYKAALEYRSSAKSVNNVSAELEWKNYNKYMNIAMTVIIC